MGHGAATSGAQQVRDRIKLTPGLCVSGGRSCIFKFRACGDAVKSRMPIPMLTVAALISVAELAWTVCSAAAIPREPEPPKGGDIP
jgi:hypothetical protein